MTLEQVSAILTDNQIKNYKEFAREDCLPSFRKMCEEIAEHCTDMKLDLSDAARLLKRMFERNQIPW